MNNHLNVFNAYTKDSRAYQLENDLTRAFAICLQEDNLFFHEVLKYILSGSNFYNQLFEDLEGISDIKIDIQKPTSSIGEFEHVFAVSLSETEMNSDNFWSQNHHQIKDPICDLVIIINNLVIIFETKRNGVDCTSQLYNQVFNTFKHINNEIEKLEKSEIVTPKDLSWPKLMEITVKISSFEKATKNQNRFVSDFIDLVKKHNFRWLPEPPISSLKSGNKNSIERRIQSAVEELSKDNKYNKLSDRLGFSFTKSWAQEVIFSVSDGGSLEASIYPGNTKDQGVSLFKMEPRFNSTIEIDSADYQLHICYHIKFTSFQKFFTGLWFTESNLSQKLYTVNNFWNYSGRKKKGEEWNKIEALLDQCFKSEYNWKKECKWNEKVINSGKNQFDISFGYEVSIVIPFEILKSIDQKKSDLSGLMRLMEAIYDAFSNKLLA